MYKFTPPPPKPGFNRADIPVLQYKMTQFFSFLTYEPGFTVFPEDFIPAFRGFFAEKPGRTGGTSLLVNIEE